MTGAEIAFEPGSVIGGKYVVERVLGRGGMGIVIAARHIELDERFALKFLLPEGAAQADMVARFMREGKAAVKIRSEHVARIFDVGKLEHGLPYLVMEYLEGHDLAALVERGPLPVALAADYLLQACEAVAEAHALGMVHRDLKPANLFLVHRVDGSPCVKVLDFGISKVAAGATSEASMTRTSAIMGSPLYMSPEQMTSARAVDARSDIWALGVILYELVTGRSPFVADTLPQVCGLILQMEPAPASELLPHAPAGLDAVLRGCLAKRANDRFANVAELANALVALASPQGQHSADRIGRVLKSPPRSALSSQSEVAAVRAPQFALESGANAVPAVSAAPTPLGPNSAAGPAQTLGSWGKTGDQAPPPRKPLPVVLFAAVAVILVGVSGLFVALLRHRSGDAPEPRASASAEIGAVNAKETPNTPGASGNAMHETQPQPSASVAVAAIPDVTNGHDGGASRPGAEAASKANRESGKAPGKAPHGKALGGRPQTQAAGDLFEDRK
jgi:serine/threonine protein kinase